MLEISRVAVIGAGKMGHGIAQVLAYAVPHVAMYDVSQEILENAHSRISQSLQLLQRRAGRARPRPVLQLRQWLFDEYTARP